MGLVRNLISHLPLFLFLCHTHSSAFEKLRGDNGVNKAASNPSSDEIKQFFRDADLQSGYLKVGHPGGEMFYALVPHRYENITAAPLVLWLTGGPGCASEIAMLKENGPFTLDDAGTLSRNPYSWSEAANMLYVDQPLGVGFSIAGDWMNYANNEHAIADVMRSFLVGFLHQYPQFQRREFFLSGESYAGHFLSSISVKLLKEPIEHLNFQGLALGNAWAVPKAHYHSNPRYAYDHGMIDHDQYRTAQKDFDTCTRLLNAHMWSVAYIECNLATQKLLGDRNQYDIRLKCEEQPLCYNMTSVHDFMNRPVVQAQLGVNQPWQFCNMLYQIFMFGDWVSSVTDEYSYILNQGLNVLVYHGDQDYVVNWYGGHDWTRQVDWKHQEGWRAQKLSPWNVDSVPAGEMQVYENLSFYRIYGAGHMAPMDKPKEALSMFKKWLCRSAIRPTEVAYA